MSTRLQWPSGSGGLSLILALGITQITGYGCLYYAFAVLAPKLTASFGWAPEWTYGGFSAGLLAGGLAAPAVGRLVDAKGARLVMSIGSGLAGLSLLALAEARGIWSYVAAMALLQATATMVFYDAAFAALSQARGAGARRAISQLTLIGGFASTLFWPLTSTLLGSFDWREIFRIYALLQVCLCLPLHLVFLPRGRGPSKPAALPGAAAMPVADSHLDGAARRRAFWLLALAFSLQGFVISAMSVHMLSLLQGLGLSAAVAVTIGALIGPSQVAGRLVEMLFGAEIAPTTTAWTSACLMPLGLALLMTGATTAMLAGAFAIAFGISMGLGSIVRGTVPLQLFGSAGYGAMLGRLAAPGLVIRAAAPLAFAVLVERIGVMPSTGLLVLLSTLAAVALFALARRVRS